MTILPTPPALSQVWLLEAQWSDIPKDVQDEVKKIWRENNYGNDYYYFVWDKIWDDDEQYPALAKYLSERNVTKCLIHYWW